MTAMARCQPRHQSVHCAARRSSRGYGWINAFYPLSGMFLGTLSNAQLAPIATPGLWGIAFGNDAANQPHNTLFFVAGTNNQAGGLYRRIDVGATAPPGY